VYVHRSARDFLPSKIELPVLRAAAQACRGCDLYCHATQAVFGEGPATASVMFVGEQPGDSEDRAGKPFVGPAGKVLDEALEAAGIDRGEVYVTNTVKHFKFEQRGKRRIHAKPGAREIAACVPWLEAEVAAVQPKLIVALGATAAQALMGRQFRVTKDRGTVFTDTPWAPGVIATTHPSMILRVPDPAAQKQAYADFVTDLKTVRKEMARITRDQAAKSAAKRMADLHPGQYAPKDLAVPPEPDKPRVWSPA
jgi:DNA polymerase